MPNPLRLFHISAIENLPSICHYKALLNKNAIKKRNLFYINIAIESIQVRRSVRQVPNPPGGNLHDYVPFYFAPRSPMLYTINKGNVEGCDLTQADILHFETTLELALKHEQPFVIYDRNASLAYSVAYTDLTDLDKVDWDLITESGTLDGYCKYWHNDLSNLRYADRMEKRMAEFLVRSHVPITSITRIGVISAQKQQRVQEILRTHRIEIPVAIMPAWYF